jgi:hypothetical protein
VRFDGGGQKKREGGRQNRIGDLEEEGKGLKEEGGWRKGGGGWKCCIGVGGFVCLLKAYGTLKVINTSHLSWLLLQKGRFWPI